MKPELSVIITNHKDSEFLKLCLESVRAAAQGMAAEFFVIDSEAQDETAEIMADKFSEFKYFPFAQNVGYAKMVNKGLKEAQGDYMAVLNGDIVVEKDAFRKLLDFMKASPEAGMAGPQLLNFNETVQDSTFRFYRPMTIFYRRSFLGKTSWGKKELARFSMADFDRQSQREVEWLMGAALIISRRALGEVGPMDERYFLYLEDTDWCRRFWEKGFKVVYFPQARMHHYHGHTSRSGGGLLGHVFNKYSWIHLSSAIKYFWKWRKK